MIKRLKTFDIGPSNVDLQLGQRLNLLTGDNGLGKSFLFDIIWFAHTRLWLHEIDPAIRGGYPAKPNFTDQGQPATIAYTLKGEKPVTLTFDQDSLKWKNGQKLQSPKSGLVFYITADGNYCFYDSLRTTDEQPAFLFTEQELWAGNKAKYNFKGLEDDLIVWKKSIEEQDQKSYQLFLNLFRTLTGDQHADLGKTVMLDKSGRLTVPTINLSIQRDVPILFASTAIKRILAISYFIAWAYSQHLIFVDTFNKGVPAQDITIIVDELDVHLHPRWQAEIIGALLSVQSLIKTDHSIQFFTSTHSPVVMVNAESHWDEHQDCWIDIDIINGQVVTQVRPFEKLGKASSYLKGEAFNLASERSKEANEAIEAYSALADGKFTIDNNEFESIIRQLEKTVPYSDYEIWTDVDLTRAKRKKMLTQS